MTGVQTCALPICILRKVIDERHKRTADLNKSMTRFYVGDIRHLKIRNAHQLCKLFAVGRGLVEHYDKLGVCKHRSCRMALQQIFHILRDTKDISVVLTHLFPHRKEEVLGVVVLEQKVDLVDEDIGLSSLRSVLGDTVEDTVKNNEHTDRHKLFAKLVNVIADKAAMGVHVGLLCKGIERTVGEKLDSKCNTRKG